MARSYVLARLHGGPLDGQVVQVHCRVGGWLARARGGFPSFALDEHAETFWWEPATTSPARIRRGRGEHWWFAFVRTLPGRPSFSRDHPVQHGEV
jgi:hypothetical protein